MIINVFQKMCTCEAGTHLSYLKTPPYQLATRCYTYEQFLLWRSLKDCELTTTLSYSGRKLGRPGKSSMLINLSCQGDASTQDGLRKEMLQAILLHHQRMNTAKCILRLSTLLFWSRFDQKGFKSFSTVEHLLFKARRGQCFWEELNHVCNFLLWWLQDRGLGI